MTTRHEYRLDLTRYHAAQLKVAQPVLRNPTAADGEALAQLMLDAYRSTIDYDSETLDDARQEITRLFDGEYGPLLFQNSWLCCEGETILSACLVTFWSVRQTALISYVMTAAAAKGKGLAAVVLHRSLATLQAAGHTDVHAFITEGNEPSERLHLAAGFERLPLYHWTICPTHIRQPVEEFTAEVARILDKNLVGVYLHGSLSFGCFNPNRSDIDLIVVTQALMDNETKRDVAELLLQSSAQPTPIEISFLAGQQLNPWQHPTPFDFHYSEEWREKTTKELKDGGWQQWQPNNSTVTGDVDLAGHIMVINHRGIVLLGEEIKTVFPTVPDADYEDSILRDVEPSLAKIAENPVYTILNSCRTLAWLHDGKIRSKDAGGVWAMNHLPPALRPLVWQALLAYRSANSASTQSTERNAFSRMELEIFAKFCTEHLMQHKSNHR